MITFFLAWCALSLVGTLIAVALIKTGKRRQPEADDLHADSPAVPIYKRQA